MTQAEAPPEPPKRVNLSEVVRGLLARGSGAGERSLVRLTRNARGDTQIEVAVRTDEEEHPTIAAALDTARAVYDELRGAYPMSGESGGDGDA